MIFLSFSESDITHLTIEEENFIYLCQKEYGGSVFKICEQQSSKSLRVLSSTLKLRDGRFLTSEAIFDNECELLEYHPIKVMDQQGNVSIEEVKLVPGTAGCAFMNDEHRQNILMYARSVSLDLFGIQNLND